LTAADRTLADLRRRAGLSQSQVAAGMAIGQARISAIEHSDVNTLTVATLAAYLNAVGAPLPRLSGNLSNSDLSVGKVRIGVTRA
jgi:transcriptional regulator with XRE-family HTH domain